MLGLVTIIFLGSLALYGQIVIEFIFSATVCMVCAAAMFYAFLFFATSMERVIDYFSGGRHV